MKIKIALLVVTALAGAGASVALADHGHGDNKAAKCKDVHLSGTLAAQALSLTVTKANHKAAPARSTVALALPAGSRANVEACATVAGTVTTLTIRGIEIKVKTPKVTTTTATTQ